MSLLNRILTQSVRVYNRSLRITREGWFFTGFTFAVGIAAINTGNNLMYLVLAMMLSVMVISGVLSENALKSVHIERRMPMEAWSNRPFSVQYILTNTKKLLPSYSLRIEEKGLSALSKAFLLKLSAGERVTAQGTYVHPRRGMLRFTQALIVTQFPFGLFEKTKLVDSTEQLLIYPSPIPADEKTAGESERGMEETGMVKGEGVGLFGLRDYREGDNPRRIHWKVSARAGKLILKETEALDLPMMAIVLDTSGYRPGRDEQALEEAISVCAGLAESFIKKGNMVRLITNTSEVPYGSGHPHLHRILANLALYESVPALSGALLRPGEARVIVKAWSAD